MTGADPQPDAPALPDGKAAQAVADAGRIEAAAAVLERRYPAARPDVLDATISELHSIARAWRRMAASEPQNPAAGTVPDDTGRASATAHVSARAHPGVVAGEGSDGSEESSGVALIRAERLRQVAVEGYTPEHDARHDGTQMARAAACYALHAAGVRQVSIYPLGSSWPWPWPAADFKPGDGPLAALVKAGALVAAEIDRLIDNAR